MCQKDMLFAERLMAITMDEEFRRAQSRSLCARPGQGNERGCPDRPGRCWSRLGAGWWRWAGDFSSMACPSPTLSRGSLWEDEPSAVTPDSA